MLINVQSISKSYGVNPLFTDISWGIYEGDRIGLIGPNGCGKSTLLKILMGLEHPDSGKVVQNRSAHVIYLPQEDSFKATDTIQSVLFGAEADKPSEAESHRLIWQVTGEKIFSDIHQTFSDCPGPPAKAWVVING